MRIGLLLFVVLSLGGDWPQHLQSRATALYPPETGLGAVLAKGRAEGRLGEGCRPRLERTGRGR